MNERIQDFSGVIAEHQDHAYALAVTILGDPDEAADAVQEAFVRLWRRGGHVPDAAVRPWLLKVVHNLCLDQLRRRKLVAKHWGRSDPDALPNLRAAPAPAAAPELPDSLAAALEQLPPRTRSMVMLHYCEGLPLAEIAELLDTTPGAVKVALHRARHALRQYLAPRAECGNRRQEIGS